jgi:outer membrane protein assembly factor BamB
MFHVKQRRILGLVASLGLLGLLVTGCVRVETRGWASAAQTDSDDTQIVSTHKGKLDGIDVAATPATAWTATLSANLDARTDRVPASAILPSETPFQGDLVQMGSEVVRVRSLSVNGSERELHLDRGFAGTTAEDHPAGTRITATRRPWRFPDDWHIDPRSARALEAVYGQPAIGQDGTVYVAGYNGWVYAFKPGDVNLDASDDDEQPGVAIANLDQKIVGGVALDESAGLLYVAAGDRVYALSRDRLNSMLEGGGGEIQPESSFSFKAGDEIWAAPVVADGRVLVASLDGKLYSLDGRTGSVQWSFSSSSGLVTTPVVIDQSVLVGGFDDKLFSVSLASGEVRWTTSVSNWIFSTPRVEDGRAYFGDFDGVLHAVNVNSGAEEWTLALNRGEIRGAVAVVDDFVVVGTDSGWLVGVNKQQRERAWETDLGTAIQADLVAAGHEVLLAPKSCVTPEGGTTSTYFRAVEAATGTLMRAEGVC